NDEGSQVDRLALGRPGHLTQLRTDVADEIEWITPAASTASAGERHGRTRRCGPADHCRPARTVAGAQRRPSTGLVTFPTRSRACRLTLPILGISLETNVLVV